MRHSADREPDTRTVYVKRRNSIVTKIRSTWCGRKPITEEKRQKSQGLHVVTMETIQMKTRFMFEHDKQTWLTTKMSSGLYLQEENGGFFE